MQRQHDYDADGFSALSHIIFTPNWVILRIMTTFAVDKPKIIMSHYRILSPAGRGDFAQRIDELRKLLTDYLQLEEADGRHLRYTKIFLSDAQNQYQQLIESSLYQDVLLKGAITVVEQPPLDGSKISLLVKTAQQPDGAIFQSLRLTDNEAKGQSSYLQTMLLFEKYLRSIKDKGLTMSEHLVRTWIYVANIDVNYSGVVKARNDIFRRYGLTADTHYIASTGIGGYSQTRHATVAMDFLTYPDIHEGDKKYLQALDHLNPTHEYGVAFERGTRLTLSDMQRFFISGTASIDRHGNAIFLGDVSRQTARLLENINALLKDGGATLRDMRYLTIYLRDLSDYHTVEAYMTKNYPDTPHIIVHAKVCRPEWLIEMEGIAELEVRN